jgi:excisionase family DNA binding protein
VSAELHLYTAAEVADVLRMNPQVVQRKLQAGEIPGYRIGREWRVERAQLMAWLEEHSNQRGPGGGRDPVAQFFDRDGKLKALPAPHKKREIVLERLAEAFDWERTYQEREVNEILRRFHDDVATLRRELVAVRRLVRTTDGVYKKAGPTDVLLRRA